MSGVERLNGSRTEHRATSKPATPPERPGVTPLTPDALAGGLYAKRGELKGMARRHGLTLDELARRASEPDASRTVSSLRRLAEARAGVLLARARADATTLLLSLAQSATSEETRRRACVDLLKTPAHGSDDHSDAADDDPAHDEGASASLLGLLERLGERTREDAGGRS